MTRFGLKKEYVYVCAQAMFTIVLSHGALDFFAKIWRALASLKLIQTQEAILYLPALCSSLLYVLISPSGTAVGKVDNLFRCCKEAQ